MDDIQDYWLNNVQTTVMDTFLSQNKTLSLGLIVNEVGNDQQVLEKINQGLEKHLFELNIHGWDHVNYTTLDEKKQYESLLKAREKILELFGVFSHVFIPPQSVFNNETLNAMYRSGINIISSDLLEESKLYQNKSIFNIHNVSMDLAKIYRSQGNEMNNKIYHSPAKIFFKDYQNSSWIEIPVNEILINVANNIKEYGYAVIVLHPQDFTLNSDTTGDTPINSIDNKELSDLLDVFYNLESEKIRIVGFEEIISRS